MPVFRVEGQRALHVKQLSTRIVTQLFNHRSLRVVAGVLLNIVHCFAYIFIRIYFLADSKGYNPRQNMAFYSW